MEERMEIIKDFAKKMGYKVEIFDGYDMNRRPMRNIALIGTGDSDGNPFGWSWFLDTSEEWINSLIDN